MQTKNKILLILFCVLYAAVAFVSLYHAIAFFTLANPSWLAIILAVAFEIGQAVVLFAILSNPNNKRQAMPWVLMSTLTIVQVLGNVFSSYKYMIMNNADQIQYFTKSVLFFVQSPNPDYNYVMISYIIGAILPIVALLMTSMVVKLMGNEPEKIPEKVIEDEVLEELPEDAPEVEEKVRTKKIYD